MSDNKGRSGLYDFITMIAVVVGVLYGALELRQFRQTRDAEGVLELYRTVQTPEYIRALRVVTAIPDTISVSALYDLYAGPDGESILHIMMTWESLGIMVYRGDVPIEWVDEFYRFAILTSWDRLGPLIKDIRVRTNYYGVSEWFQWLEERLLERGAEAEVPAYELHREWRPD